ncbi:MAG: SpoIIE family protein phosphatase [Bacteroidota bacterium]|nr:SpoIIE family protein phosphatase [Bacteroidota bacterium]
MNYAYSLLNLAKVYTALYVTEIAINEFDVASEIFLKQNENKGYILANIEKAYLIHRDINVIEPYKILYSILNITEENSFLQAKVQKTIADLYRDDFEHDSALFFVDKAINGFVINKNDIELADCYKIKANVLVDKENYNNALELFQKALEIYKDKNIVNKKAQTLNRIGVYFFKQEKYDQAIKIFNESLFFSESRRYIAQVLISCNYLAEIYNIKNNYEKSIYYLNKYIDYQKINFDEKTKQGFAGVVLNLQNEDKQKKIKILEKEDELKSQTLKNRELQVYGAIIAIVLFLIFTIVLYFYLQKQKKSNKLLQEQNRKITLQKKEIESQSRILEKATRNLMQQKDKIQTQNTKITSSIRYASRIQKAMLPGHRIFDKYFQNSFVFFAPKETVSGDFYWISEIREQKPSLFKSDDIENKVVVSVIDCTGHGVPGAFMSMLGDAFLNQIVNIQSIIDPSQILSELHKIVRKTLQQEHSENNDGMDLALCVIDKKAKTLKYAGAKNPLVYIQNGKMTRIHGDLMSIGGLQREAERVFRTHTVDVTVKTTIYLFSDGFQDQFGGEFGRKYMAKPFRDMIFDSYTLPFEEQKVNLKKELHKWKGKKHNQMDDITIIGFEV